MESGPSQSLETTSLQARGLIAGNKGFVTIGEVSRRIVVRAYATASERKSGTSFDTGPAVEPVAREGVSNTGHRRLPVSAGGYTDGPADLTLAVGRAKSADEKIR